LLARSVGYLWDRGKPLATVLPDGKYPGMWRGHMPGGWGLGMGELSLAKEGAILPFFRGFLVMKSKGVKPPGPLVGCVYCWVRGWGWGLFSQPAIKEEAARPWMHPRPRSGL